MRFFIFAQRNYNQLNMKKRLILLVLLILISLITFSQQIGNGNLESWDNVGTSSEEPTNWNSFKSATGSLVSLASQQIQRSTAIRSGASGVYCARIWSKSTLGIVANGNMTVGQINMGSSTPASTSNYNLSKTTDDNFSEALTLSPDSLVFWVKYTAASGSSQARVNAIIHDEYNLRDPLDANSNPHVVATATLNYLPTGGVWVRKSVPFMYTGPSTTPQFILITFTTNMTPGGGAANDEVLIDDIELIYNSTNQINEEFMDASHIYCSDNNIHIQSEKAIHGEFKLYNSSGMLIMNGKLSTSIPFIGPSGVYYLEIDGASGVSYYKLLKN